MTPTIKEEQGFQYIEEGQGEVLLLFHGLFGALSNWEQVLAQFSQRYRVIIPMLPIYELPVRQSNLEGLLAFTNDFVEAKDLSSFTLIGNSLGGHLALMYTLQNPERVKKLVLTGSSGLFENTLGGAFPRRGSYDYIAERVGYTFFDPKTVSKAYVDEVFSVTSNLSKAMRVVRMAKSAQRHNLAHELPKIQQTTLLIWGLNDTITPPVVAHEFNTLMPNSQLRFIDKCCHAPMMEQPHKFNVLLDQFLQTTA
ncbi:MAG: alpha/beta hydrolase [Bacteroidota bacterium]